MSRKTQVLLLKNYIRELKKIMNKKTKRKREREINNKIKTKILRRREKLNSRS